MRKYPWTIALSAAVVLIEIALFGLIGWLAPLASGEVEASARAASMARTYSVLSAIGVFAALSLPILGLSIDQQADTQQ